MNRATVLTAAAILALAWAADAKGLKGVDVSLSPAPRTGPEKPSAWPVPTPDAEAAIPVGKAKTDSLRIRIGGSPWASPLHPLPASNVGDPRFRSDMFNVSEGLIRRSRETLQVDTDMFTRNQGIRNRMNALAMFVSVSDGGGYGFRMLYDRRIRPSLGFNASAEFTTYAAFRLTQLQTTLPDYTTRVSVIGLYAGLQQRFGDKGRVVPRLGFGAGPIIRVDHQAPPYYYDYAYGPYVGVQNTTQGGGFDVGIPLPFTSLGFPRLSLSAGGYANAGLDVVVDTGRRYAISLDARYNLIHFFDALGNPGDFGGPALYFGFGRRF